MKFACLIGAIGCAAARNCQPERLSDYEFTRQMLNRAFNGFIKGYYNDPRQAPVSEMCMGAWMDPKVEQINKFADSLMNDGFMAISKEALYQTSNNMIDLVMDNYEHCGLYRMAYNEYTWCLNDIDGCNVDSKILGRVIENSAALIKDLIVAFKFVMADDSCSSD